MIIKITGKIPPEHEDKANRALEDSDYEAIFDLMSLKSVEVE